MKAARFTEMSVNNYETSRC